MVFFHFQHQREYQEILDAVHGSEKEKKLAAQFIAKFFKSFPESMETALDRQLDLCEDEDVQVRLAYFFIAIVSINSSILDSSSCYQGAADFLQRHKREYAENQ